MEGYNSIQCVENQLTIPSTFTAFSCFNAFSRVDVRVEVKIPGGVESYYVDVRGERYMAII